jgi:tetratricopeptide (TPR) repeat protein
MKKIFIYIYFITISFQAYSMGLEDYTNVYDSYKLEAEGKLPQAIEKMIQIYSKSTDNYLVNYRLGWLFSLEKKYQNSIEHYKKAANKKPKSIEPWLALSLLHMNLQEWSKASDFAEELILRDNHNYFGNLRYIQAKIKLKNYRSALEKLDQILNVYPMDPVFLEQKAFIFSELNKKKEAKNAVLDLLLISPNNYFAKSFMKTN